MRCALVNNTTNIVENLIIADPAVDPAPAGYILVGLPDDSPVTMGWIYDPVTETFTDPNPPQPEPIPDPVADPVPTVDPEPIPVEDPAPTTDTPTE